MFEVDTLKLTFDDIQSTLILLGAGMYFFVPLQFSRTSSDISIYSSDCLKVTVVILLCMFRKVIQNLTVNCILAGFKFNVDTSVELKLNLKFCSILICIEVVIRNSAIYK